MLNMVTYNIKINFMQLLALGHSAYDSQYKDTQLKGTQRKDTQHKYTQLGHSALGHSE